MSDIRLTVEQVYLIQQLMKSGMSKEEIVNAVEELRIEDELKLQSQSSNVPLSICDSLSQSSLASLNEPQVSNIELTQLSQPSSCSQEIHSFLVSGGEGSEEILPAPSLTDNLLARKTPTIQFEDTQALKTLKLKGDDAILRDIRKFVSAYNISQITIADMIRVSQGYVSRYMNGDFDQVSERVKNLVYLWYIECRANPQFLKHCLGSKAVMSDNGVLLPVKRDKFKFQKCHLEVLERFFKQENYPNNEAKKIIVESCNYALSKLENRHLDESEKVTINLVNNWFNNRRKELKK